MRNKIYNENCLTGLKKLPENSIDCCITSPPYFGLRDYGTAEQIGLEETPELFVAAMVEVFTEVKRVLKNDGTLWLNLGDSYSGAGGASGHNEQTMNLGAKTKDYGAVKSGGKRYGLKAKDLIGIPWMVAFALRSSGWYLRQDIIWNKPNPMPESVTDRCTKSHEYIFLMSKSAKYYYDNDSIKTDATYSSIQRTNQDLENQKGSDRVPGKTNGNMKAISTFGNRNGQLNKLHSGNEYFPLEKANKRSVWTVTTKPFSEAHFATFPQDLIVDMVKAGCPEDGIILDPFMGAGTTAVVARKLNRNYVGFELNTAYIKIAENRLRNELGMYL
jgi:DNA modification methylase